MDGNGGRKSFDTPFGSSVISESPLSGPPAFLSNHTLPGTQQVCGPCSTSGRYCPIHSTQSSAAAGTRFVVQGQAVQVTPVETISSIVGDFLTKLTTHVSNEVAAKVLTELRAEMEARDKEPHDRDARETREVLESVYPRTVAALEEDALVEIALTLLADRLDEDGFTTLLAIDEQQIAKMVVADDPRCEGKTITIKVVGGGWPPDQDSALFKVDYQDPGARLFEALALTEDGVLDLFKWLRAQPTATA